MKLKLIIKITTLVMVTAILVVTPLWIIPSLKHGIAKTPLDSYQGIINVWHIDSFEGGLGSRASWLINRSVEFEKQNKNVFIIVKNISITELEISLSKGEKPDLISYGLGIGEIVKDILSEYEGLYNVRNDILSSGIYNDKLYAVPWCMGGYTLIGLSKFINNTQKNDSGFLLNNVTSINSKTVGKDSRVIYSVIFGNALSNNPLAALIENGIQKTTNKNAFNSANNGISQLTAYERFMTEGNSVILLGTQRDIIRCEAKVQLGKCSELIFEPLSGYTDLIQYISVTKDLEKDKKNMCEKFIEFITSFSIQNKMTGIGLFNVTGERIYLEGNMGRLEESLQSNLKTVNVFTKKEDVLNSRETNLNKIFI